MKDGIAHLPIQGSDKSDAKVVFESKTVSFSQSTTDNTAQRNNPVQGSGSATAPAGERGDFKANLVSAPSTANNSARRDSPAHSGKPQTGGGLVLNSNDNTQATVVAFRGLEVHSEDWTRWGAIKTAISLEQLLGAKLGDFFSAKRGPN